MTPVSTTSPGKRWGTTDYIEQCVELVGAAHQADPAKISGLPSWSAS